MVRLLPILLIALLLSVRSNGQEVRGPGQESRAARLYPNPATTQVTIDLSANYQKGLSIAIFNFLGKKMTDLPNVTTKTNVSLTDYNRGIYIYHIIDGTGKVIDTGKFQVSK